MSQLKIDVQSTERTPIKDSLDELNDERDAFFKASEEQDQMIARGIKLICCKVLDLIKLCSRFRLNMDDEKSYTLLSTRSWLNSIVAVHDELEAWELHNVGKQQFASSFKFLVDHLAKIDQKNSLQANSQLENISITEQS